MTPLSPPKRRKSRRVEPKVLGRTASPPCVPGAAAWSSLRALTGRKDAAEPRHRPSGNEAKPSQAPGPAAAPGMRRLPATKPSGDVKVGVAVSVRKALAEQAAQVRTAPEPTLLDTRKPNPRKSNKAKPARPAVRGRPTQPTADEEAPLTHAPAVRRPGPGPQWMSTLRSTGARHPTAPRVHRRRVEPWVREASRPRPSRVLAEELHAANADEAGAAE